MPQPRFRSRTFRRIDKKLPGGKTVVHYEKRAPGQHVCAVCKIELKGTPKLRTSKMQKLGISKKRPQRPYGGYLCSKCAREKIKADLRQ